MTILAYQQPAGTVAADLASQCGVGCVVDPSLSAMLIDLELVDVDGEAAFRALAGALGRDPVLASGIVTFGPPGQGDRETTVLRSGYFEGPAYADAIRSLVGERALVVTLGDRVVVSGDADRVSAIEAISGQLSRGTDGWLLEVRFVAVTRSLRRALGLEWVVGGRVGVSVDAGAGNLTGAAPVVGARAQLAVEIIGEALELGSDAKLLRSSQMFVLENRSARMQQGSVVPVPQRTTSNEGTVTTTGFDLIETGFAMTATAKRAPGGRVLLELAPSVSAVSGYVDGYPIVDRSIVESGVVLRSTESVILWGFEGADVADATKGLPGAAPPWGQRSDSSVGSSSVVVLVRATRVFRGD